MDLNNSVLEKNSEIAARQVDDEYFVVTLSDGALHRLNTMGGKVFEAVDGCKKISEIVSAVVEAYEVEEETAVTDISEYLQKLVEAEIVVGKTDNQDIV